MEEILNAYQVSEILRIPLNTVYYLTKNGRLRAVKIGKHWRYTRKDIQQYLDYGTVRPFILPKDDIRERRLFPRINCSLPCSINVAIPKKRELSAEGIITNISCGGVFIEYDGKDNPFSKILSDDPVKMEFELEQRPGMVEGRILRLHNGGAAVKFRNISEEIKNRIGGYVG